MCYITKNSFTVADISKQTSFEYEIWQVGTEGGADKKREEGAAEEDCVPSRWELSTRQMFEHTEWAGCRLFSDTAASSPL